MMLRNFIQYRSSMVFQKRIILEWHLKYGLIMIIIIKYNIKKR